MTEEKPEIEEDEILKRLNKQLEDDDREKRIIEEIEKRQKAQPREAVFKTKDGGKKKVQKETKHDCPRCGSEDTERLDEDGTIYKYRGDILSYIGHCKDCEHKWGITK